MSCEMAQVIGPTVTAAIKVVNEVGVNNVKITPDILISAAGGDQGATSLLSTWLAQAVARGLIDGKKDAPLHHRSAQRRTRGRKGRRSDGESPNESLRDRILCVSGSSRI